MTLASLTTLIILQYPLVPTSDLMMLVLLAIAGWFLLKLVIKGLVIIGCGIAVIFKFLPYLLTGRTKEYFAEIEEKEREEKRKKEEEFWKKWIENGKNL